MKIVITYGTYDLLHFGHIALLKRAKALGDYLIVGVTSDAFDKSRGKLNVKQSLVERIDAVRATGIADKIIVEEYDGQKISDILEYNVDVFTVGSDWIGKFDYLREFCEVTYLERTQGISSTEIRLNDAPAIKIGLIGLKNPTVRFISEVESVAGAQITSYYCDDIELEKSIAHCEFIKSKSIKDLHVDAVYISDTIDKHFDYIMEALSAGYHVLCESPLFLSEEEANKAYTYADEKGLVLFEAMKTMYFPAFEHLLLLIRTGIIGEIKDIDVTFSKHTMAEDRNKYEGALYDLGSYVLMPIIKILGREYKDLNLYLYQEKGFDIMAKGLIQYEHAVASFKAGKGIKAEGNLMITGTTGYIYVPAPWWLTDYFEIRYEDLRKTKKFFFKCEGYGLRYEIIEFVKMINGNLRDNYKYSRADILAITKVLEAYHRGNVKKI